MWNTATTIYNTTLSSMWDIGPTFPPVNDITLVCMCLRSVQWLVVTMATPSITELIGSVWSIPCPESSTQSPCPATWPGNMCQSCCSPSFPYLWHVTSSGSSGGLIFTIHHNQCMLWTNPKSISIWIESIRIARIVDTYLVHLANSHCSEQSRH